MPRICWFSISASSRPRAVVSGTTAIMYRKVFHMDASTLLSLRMFL